jgi:rhodanese-related sulfurtransferase
VQQTVTVKQLREQAKRPQMIDVRSASEFAAGHVPGAVNIPLEQIEGRLEDFEADRQILLICQSGMRARLAAGMLETCRQDVAVLEGGTAAWIKEGLPVVASVKSRWSLERQVRLGAGLLVLAGVALAIVADTRWVWLSGFAGMGLTFAGLTDLCPMAVILGKMPWNRPSQCHVPDQSRTKDELQAGTIPLRSGK